MNRRRAFYTYPANNPNKVYGPFIERRSADDYAAAHGHAVTDLSGNDILRGRIRVTGL